MVWYQRIKTQAHTVIRINSNHGEFGAIIDKSGLALHRAMYHLGKSSLKNGYLCMRLELASACARLVQLDSALVSLMPSSSARE